MSNVELAYQHFVNEGFTPAQAAGIVGNLIQESGVNPESVQQGGPGRGIAQWSQGGRWIPSLMTGNPAVDLQAQLNYIDQELQSNPGYGLATLKQASDPTTAAQIFGSDYERYGVAGARLQDATQVAQEAQQGNWPTTPTTAGLTADTSQQGGQQATLDSSGSSGLWGAIKAVIGINTGADLGGNPLSDVGKISEELGSALAFGAKKQPQNVSSVGFLNSLDEMLNPSVSLLNPWGIITETMARGGLVLLGLALLAGGLIMIVLSIKPVRDTLVGAGKTAAKAAIL